MTAYEILKKAVTDAKFEVDKYDQSVKDWQADPTYLAYKAKGAAASAGEIAYIIKVDKNISDRNISLRDWRTKYQDAVQALANYENTSPIAKAEAQSIIERASSSKILVIGGLLLAIGITITLIFVFRKKQPTT